MFFKLIEKEDVIVVFKEDKVFVVSSVVDVVVGFGIDLH